MAYEFWCRVSLARTGDDSLADEAVLLAAQTTLADPEFVLRKWMSRCILSGGIRARICPGRPPGAALFTACQAACSPRGGASARRL